MLKKTSSITIQSIQDLKNKKGRINGFTYLILLIIIVIILYLSFKIYLPTEPQLDHLHIQTIGNLKILQPKNISLNNLQITSQANIIQITYKSKNIFKSNNFLNIYQSQGNIKSHGDSFYKVTDQTKKICKNQLITNININKQTINIQGYFQDCNNSNYQISLFQQNNTLKISIKASKQFNRVQILFEDNQNKIYYGFGQQFSYLSLGRQRPYSVLVREKGVGRSSEPLTILSNLRYGIGGNYYCSYASLPIWISNDKTGYIIQTYSYLTWINNRIRVWNNQFSMIFISQNSMKNVVAKIAEFNGITPPIPDWINNGAIIGLQGGTQSVNKKYLTLKSSGTKISALWLQDWVSKRISLGNSRLWWNWELDEHHYPNWLKFKQQLNKNNIQILLYINPMFSDPQTKSYRKINYFQKGINQNVFVKHSNNQFFKTRAFTDYQSYLLNFSNVNSIRFFKNIVQRTFNETGAKGMMVDFGQAYPMENMGYPLEKSIETHNQYPKLYLKIFHNYLEQIFGKDNDIYTFSRAASLNTPKYIKSLWAGDQTMNFDIHNGLPSCVVAMLSSGLVGFANTHCDIGGYTYIDVIGQKTSVRSENLMIKWMQLGAFSPVYRTHEGNRPLQSLQVYSNQRLLQKFALYSNIYKILSKYRKKNSQISSKNKLPLIRGMFLQHEDNKDIAQIQDQFYLGNDILVSPFIKQSNTRRYYLPNGKWKYLWNGSTIQGCNCWKVHSGQFPPVFIKQQSQFVLDIIQQISTLLTQQKIEISQSENIL